MPCHLSGRDPFPLSEIVAVPGAPVTTTSPVKIVASEGAGTPFMDTDPVEVMEPIDCGVCALAAPGGSACEGIVHSTNHVKTKVRKDRVRHEIMQDGFEKSVRRGHITHPVQN